MHVVTLLVLVYIFRPQCYFLVSGAFKYFLSIFLDWHILLV